MKRFAFLSATGACICLSAACGLRAAEFGLDFLGLPEVIRGSPGRTVSLDVYVVLSCPAGAPAGVRGWSIGIQGDGAIDTGNSIFLSGGIAVTGSDRRSRRGDVMFKK